ncbi:hypothetical protein J5N97_007829 [Dioscorea zingiberensis]|uniref:Eukaryotic translation initiation factor 4B2 n=1 Tax=Dioscorea zingiberensis TaxID=325984 RepID=A0A9D5DCN4_9LILI|nr:hypothetical protein J5N97_007829 [Dioscorea zingiberensis]
MSKPWGSVGAWALDAERAEAEERERAASEEAMNHAVLAGQHPQSFPSLKEATSAKTKKKKPATMSLAEFATGSYPGPGGGRRETSLEPKGLTPDEMLRLPTGPRERSAEELEQGRLGGGFRSYGYGTGSRGGRRSDDGEGRRAFGGGFDDDSRRGSPMGRASDFDQPSRADEVDNWAAAKKTSSFGPPPGDVGRQDRYSSLGGGGSSRADDVDNWAAGKKPLPIRNSSYGSGFRDSSGDRWGPALRTNDERERPRLVLDPPKKNVGEPVEPQGKNRSSPFGVARPREEVLAEKGLDWRKVDSEIEIKQTGRPGSSHSSRPSSAHSSRPGTSGSSQQAAAAATGEGAVKPRQKVNPFGDAKPREVLLQEKGKDWRKIDLELEHRSVDRSETHEEKLLKEEISHLKKSLAKENEGNLSAGPTHVSEELARIQVQIAQRERDLELLIRELDDKVRFGQRATSVVVRPGSGAGRTLASFERPLSQSGRLEESSSMDFTNRPQSRGGNEDAWSKPVEESRQYHGSRGSSFYGNRDMDRPRSRERW